MANVPTLKVEFAPTNTPLETAPTWVDISAYVRGGVTVRRGRQSELDNFDAGTATLTLSNRDRRFDPSYSAGPYFGNLLPRKRIRLTATWSAVDYPMFTGWVTGWPQAFNSPAGKDATVAIQAIDPLAWLSQTNLPIDLVYSYAHDTIGSLALFLRGADTSSWNDASSSGYGASLAVGTGRTSTSLAPGMASTTVAFDGSTAWTTASRFQAAGAWSLSFWIQTTQTATGDIGVAGGYNSTTSATTYVQLVPGGLIDLQIDTLGVGIHITATGTPVNDGIPHHVVFTCDNVSVGKCYIDGVDRTTAVTFTSAQPFILDTIGNVNLSFVVSTTFAGSLQDVALFNKQLSTAEVLAFYQRSHGYLEEDATTRVNRLLDDVGWPATWRTLTTTPESICGELVYNAANANEKLQEVQATEQGRIFAGKDGNLTFLSRYYVQEVTAGNTIQQIFSDDGGATALPYSTFGFDPTDLDMCNQATVTTPTTYAASSDATSITNYGRQSRTVDTILTTFDFANSMAEGLVAAGKAVRYRTASITVYPVKNTTRWDEVLGLELGHRISMEITPMAVGSQQVQELTLEQTEWDIADQFNWALTVGGSPIFGTATTSGWFIWGSSLVDGPDVIGY